MVTPEELGTHVGRSLRLKKKKKSTKVVSGSVFIDHTLSLSAFPDLGTIVGRALVRGGHVELSAKLKLVEFRRDPSDWQDPEKVYGSLGSGSRAGLGGKFITHAELGGRLGRDIYRATTGDQSAGAQSAATDNFKITENSRNTARVTVGPDRRVRRPKYEWERAETRRKIQKALLTAAVVGGGALGIHLHKKGDGNIFKGVGVVGKEIGAKVADVSRGVGAAVTGQPYIPRRITASTNSSVEKEIARKIEANRIAREAAKHTPTPQADGVHANEIPFKKP